MTNRRADFVMFSVIGVAVFASMTILVMVVWSALRGVRGELPAQRMYRACVADGVKPYECYGIVYGGRRR